jgi:hypothetical protein
MKRLFFIILLIQWTSILFGQNSELKSGVLIVYNQDPLKGAKALINNIPAFAINKKSVVYYTYYSNGRCLFEIKDGETGKSYQKNIELYHTDTIRLKIQTKNAGGFYHQGQNNTNFDWTIEEISKDDANKLVINTAEIIFSQEDIRFPFIPSSYEIKLLPKRYGTGFLISKNKYVITNYHVIEKANTIRVCGVNGNKKSHLSTKLVYYDSLLDLALLKLDDNISINNVPFILGQSNSMIGEDIFVLGYPLLTTMGQDIKLTNGLISSINGFKGDTISYQISSAIQPGNSGAPLFNKSGELVGVVNAKHLNAENVGYAIKVSNLRSFIKKSGIKDIAFEKINSLSSKPPTQQVKAIQDFVYIVEAE